MTYYRQNRLSAAGLRMLAGVAALAGLLGLSACGGGSGAPNNSVSTTGTIALLPATLVAYSGNPVTLTLAGGLPPYTIFSSDQVTLPVQTSVPGNSVTIFPNNVSADNTVTLTTRDARGDSASSTVTVKSSPLINSLKLKADSFPGGDPGCPNAGGSASANDDASSTFICSGQTGTVSVRVASTVSGGLAGRLVRFDVIQGPFQLFTEFPGQPPSFALSYTVPSDVNGDAVARIRADPAASQQIVIVQATDVATGTFVRGVFVISQVAGGNTSGMSVLPATVTITGPDTLRCSSGVSTSYYVFGGQPPYTVSNTFPQFLSVSPNVVHSSGGGFTATTTGACIDNGLIVVTDSLGHSITVTLSNKLGTLAPPASTSPNPINVTPSPVPLLACGASTNVVATGGGTTTTTGNTTTVTPPTAFFTGVNRPDIISAIPPSPAPGATITVTRLGSGTVNGSLAPTATVNVTLLISDSGQTKSVNVPVQNTCP